MNLEREDIDYKKLYDTGTNLVKYTIQIQENLTKIDNHIKEINDEKIWNSKVKDSLLEKYMEERERLNLIYKKLVSYSNYILEIVKESEEFAKLANKLVESIKMESLWQI